MKKEAQQELPNKSPGRELSRQTVSRRRFLGSVAAASSAALLLPRRCRAGAVSTRMRTRPLGRTGFEISTLGLGGQGALHWTRDDLDPVRIVLKALDQGINYLDTANVYADSQAVYGKVFRERNLIPGAPGYDEKQRQSIWLNSKSYSRFGNGGPNTPGMTGGGSTVADIKRTLSQVYGDGKGQYPAGAYVDSFYMHSIQTPEDVAAVWEGFDRPDPKAERIGGMAVLRDYRDGTNLTGLNPREEKVIRHIGFSGHFSPAVHMEMLQRDETGIIDIMFVAVNANDRSCFSHINNSIPVAVAKGVAVLAMKAFSNGAMFRGGSPWATGAKALIKTVGNRGCPSHESLLHYCLSIPGVCSVITGIGHIDDDPQQCQLLRNLAAVQKLEGPLDADGLLQIEDHVLGTIGARTNGFQAAAQPLGAPRDAAVLQKVVDEGRMARLSWQSAYAADEPIDHYAILRDGQPLAKVPYRPQTTKEPLSFDDPLVDDRQAHTYSIVTVDAAQREAATSDLKIESIG
ncbi:MAG: aldo/keto reductase [Planctomycetes bacterium]|nr:aldo/keto reductase [Planctomycetota bacterium]